MAFRIASFREDRNFLKIAEPREEFKNIGGIGGVA